MTERERLKTLVERLPDAEVHAAVRYLEYLEKRPDPVAAALRNAPLDDEPVTTKDRQALEEAEEDLRHGHTASHEDARRILLD